MRLFRKKQGVYLACLKNKAKDKKKKTEETEKTSKKKETTKNRMDYQKQKRS